MNHNLQMQYRETDDLTKLEEITLDNVLECLASRFLDSKFYTFAGTVLISLNPCFKTKADRKSIDGQSTSPLHQKNGTLPPHVYSVGQKCLQNLNINGNNQVVVVSGDSGAGKTTATQQLLCYFIEKNPTNEVFTCRIPNSSGLEQKIYIATLILECFGNASTTSNPNSSRFGRLLQLNYHTVLGIKAISGAQIQTCLLEKHRVSKCEKNERNFHIFYYVLVAIKKGIFQPECATSKTPDSLKIIPSYFYNNLRESDEEDFVTFWNSVCDLGLQEEFINVFRIIYGIMILLNISFIPASDQFQHPHKETYTNSSSASSPEKEVNNEEKENFPTGEDSPCFNYQNPYFGFGQRKKSFVVANDESFDTLEDIFQIDIYSLMDSLLARNITAGRRKSTVRKPCETIKEIQERKNALVTTIYDALFNFILNRLNSLLNISQEPETAKGETEHMEMAKISLLDLYGFENLETNHLEQLCINYANERLQQVHISHLKCVMSQFPVADLDISEPKEINRVQMEISLRLDTLHSVLFSILNEVCMLNRSQTDEQVFDRLTESTKSNDFIARTRKSYDENCSFVVKHYATQVEYNFKGMVDKNRDYIPLEFIDILQSSSSAIINSVFPSEKTPVGCKTASNRLNRSIQGKLHNVKTKREKTVLQRFKASVEGLVNHLEIKNNENQDVQFIRCLRPNDNLIQGKIDKELLKKQLYACGIVDVIRISGNGFPIRIPTAKFFAKFRTTFRRCFHSSSKDRVSERISRTSTATAATKSVDFDQDKFRELFNLSPSDLKFGISQVYLTEKCYQFLSDLDLLIWRHIVTHVQRTWRSIKRYRGSRFLNSELLVAEKESEEISRRLYLEEMLKLEALNDETHLLKQTSCQDEELEPNSASAHKNLEILDNVVEFQTPLSTVRSRALNSHHFRRGRRATVADPNSHSRSLLSDSEYICENAGGDNLLSTEKLGKPVNSSTSINPNPQRQIHRDIRQLNTELYNSSTTSSPSIFLKSKPGQSGDFNCHDYDHQNKKKQLNPNNLLDLVFLDPHKLLYSNLNILVSKRMNNIRERRKSSLFSGEEMNGAEFPSPNPNISPLSQSFNSYGRKSKSKSTSDLPSSSLSTSLKLLCNFDLFLDGNQSIASRRQIYKGPIKFYTKPTALRNNHIVPLRLKCQGLADILDA